MKLTFAHAALTLALAAAAAASASSREILEIRVRGHYYTEPATVRITVAVEPAANHRSLVIAADGPQYFRSSALSLDGDREKRLHSVEFKNIPAGSYLLRAEVRSSDDVLAVATQDLVVTGHGGGR